jgi:transmembrane sensor
MPHREPASEIEDAATIWAAKAERGLTESERAELDQWFDGDSRRLGAYVRAQAAWIHAERAVALGGMPEPAATPLEEVHVPEVEETPPRSFSRRMMLGGGGALAASVAAAWLIGVDRYRTLESGIGEIRHIALKNGATLTLDTDSRVDVALSSSDRKLDLVRGKMFLTVTRSQESPLIVRAGGLMLETVEGAFGLQNLVTAPISVLVTEGRLLVSQSPGMFGQRRSLALEKDHVLTLSAKRQLLASDIRPVAAAQREQFLAWRDGMLSFGGEALADAVRAFDRYGPARIAVVDPDLAQQKVTGLFKADDPRGFATAIAASFGAIVTVRGDVIRISTKKSVSA